MAESKDGAVYLGGITKAFGIVNEQNGFVAKVSSNGELMWMKMLGGLLTTTF